MQTNQNLSNSRYKEHNYMEAKNKKIKCKVRGCKCKCFYYIPVHGSYDFKCLCKHSYRLHDPVTRKCTKCNKCQKFTSKWSCSCGLKFDQHKTVIETREERARNGGKFGEVDLMLMGNVNAYDDENVQLYYQDKLNERQPKALGSKKVKTGWIMKIGYLIDKKNTYLN